MAVRAAAPYALGDPILQEGFEDDTLPAAWQRFSLRDSLPASGWQPTRTLAHSGSGSIFHAYASTYQDAWLVTPQFTPTLTSRLEFWEYERYPLDYHLHQVLISSGSADPKDYQYTLLADLPAGPAETWHKVSLDLAAYGGTPIYAAFRYQGDEADTWFLDDVQVTTGLQARSDAPTILGEVTTFRAVGLTGAGISYAWDFGDGQVAAGGETTHQYTAAGPFSVTLSANDGGDILTSSIVVDVDEPAAGLTVVSSSPVRPGTEVDFSATLTAGSNLHYRYDFGDGSAPVEGNPTPSHLYAAGTYTATVVVTNSLSVLTAALPVIVQAPVSGLSAASDGPTALGAATTFSAAVVSGGEIADQIAWSWDFGDGATAAEQNPVHTYAAAGVYTATVTAANARSAESVAVLVVVSIPPGRALLHEDFESAAFPPAGWGLFSGSSGTLPWLASLSQAHSPTRSAFHDGVFDLQDAWLVSPPVIPGPGSALTFWQYENRNWLYRGHSVWVLTEGQNPKDNEPYLLADLGKGKEDAWELVSLDLAPWQGKAIWLAFRYQGADGDQWWLDDVAVTSELTLAASAPTRLGMSTTFTATLPTGTHLGYTWDFGDGQQEDGAVGATHTYAQPGIFTTTVTARNSLDVRTAQTTVAILAADLSLALTAPATQVVAGEGLTYTLTVTNTGPFAAPTTLLTATLPSGFSPAAAVADQGTCAWQADLLTCALDEVAVGGTRRVVLSGQVAASVRAGQTLTLDAEVASTLPDQDPTANQVRLDLTALTAADLLLDLAPLALPAIPGEPITYVLTVTNYRPSDAAGVEITGTIPAGTTWRAWEGGPTATCAAEPPGYRCRFGTLAAGQSLAVQIGLQIDPAARAALQPAATVTSQDPDPIPGNNQVARTDPLSPAADVRLTTVPLAPQTLTGAPFTYTLTLTNTGPSLATAVVLTSTLPVGMEALALPLGCQVDAELVTCRLPDLEVNQPGVLIFRLRAPGVPGDLSLAAAVAAAEPDPYPENSVGWQTEVVSEQAVYQLNGTPGAEWSLPRQTTSPSGQVFLGEFGDEALRLLLADLPVHRRFRVSFDLLLLRSWDGNLQDATSLRANPMLAVPGRAAAGLGPDIWRLRAAEETLLHTTFSNWSQGGRQAFPGSYPGGDYPAQTGAVGRDSLGYAFANLSAMDSVYHLAFSRPHTSTDLALEFAAIGLQDLQDESWGLAQVQVWISNQQAVFVPFVSR
jgi:uncharacterized repeat protein (TIGR01451 family)